MVIPLFFAPGNFGESSTMIARAFFRPIYMAMSTREGIRRVSRRIMRIEEKADAIVIETTDIHLPHAIGEALHDAFKGSLKFRWIHPRFTRSSPARTLSNPDRSKRGT
jgi:hypothetical protein